MAISDTRKAFNAAFSQAAKEGKKTFQFQGKSIKVEFASEKKTPEKGMRGDPSAAKRQTKSTRSTQDPTRVGRSDKTSTDKTKRLSKDPTERVAVRAKTPLRGPQTDPRANNNEARKLRAETPSGYKPPAPRSVMSYKNPEIDMSKMAKPSSIPSPSALKKIKEEQAAVSKRGKKLDLAYARTAGFGKPPMVKIRNGKYMY